MAPNAVGASVRLLAAALWGGCALAPLIWMALAALQPSNALLGALPTLPIPPSAENLLTAIVHPLLFGTLLNSIVVSTTGALISTLVASLAGFGMAQLPARTQRLPLALFLVAALIPAGAIWLGRFFVIRSLGLMNTHAALVSYGLLGGTPITLLLCWVAARRIPVGVLDAARLDTASGWQLWWRIGLPQMWPAVFATLALSGLAFWSDSITPALVLKSPALYTWPIGLGLLQQLERTRWGLVMAACLLVTLPGVIAVWLGRHQINARGD